MAILEIPLQLSTFSVAVVVESVSNSGAKTEEAVEFADRAVIRAVIFPKSTMKVPARRVEPYSRRAGKVRPTSRPIMRMLGFDGGAFSCDKLIGVVVEWQLVKKGSD